MDPKMSIIMRFQWNYICSVTVTIANKMISMNLNMKREKFTMGILSEADSEMELTVLEMMLNSCLCCVLGMTLNSSVIVQG